ncbi:MAG: pyridoxamine 5'-phosphate oxidase family protein [Methylocystis sp.]|nr:pyridoxamine 5'-phosphate oxidase family protein [Methylocystis sp.]MCA3583717.1 pyridoxamine 5'-phosphate oxidase family protein [Methylocystis sp.]MCA3587729.1 pyridoxamine 5'-phosphate oxidase family protein [Methylocystis sp.]MCA3590009.1 pyridoxamine 5'-phosphate oxidase family protein [Methylocystis sp.]
MQAASDSITSLAELEALYAPVNPTAILKEIDHINAEYAKFIEAAPFVILSTVGPEGLDCSPRGDPAGFVRVADPKTLLIPDRKGNNRVDSLRNIVRDPRIALLFLIPGIGNTMRVNGRATLVTDKALCGSFAMRGNPPLSVIRVSVESAYPQCPKALVRSRLWDASMQIERSALPSTGAMMKAIDPSFDAATYEAEYPARMERTIY